MAVPEVSAAAVPIAMPIPIFSCKDVIRALSLGRIADLGATECDVGPVLAVRLLMSETELRRCVRRGA